MSKRGVYVCPSRSCRMHGVEFHAMLPADVRLATGRPVRCSACGGVVSLRRVEATPNAGGAS